MRILPPSSARFANVAVALMLVLVAMAPVALAKQQGDTRIDSHGAAWPPVMRNAYFLDLDGNGRFDAVAISFGADRAAANNQDDDREPVLETIRPRDFSVQDHVVISCLADGDRCAANPTIGASPINFDTTAGTLEVVLTLEESYDYRTGGTLPTVAYTQGTIADLDGHLLASGDIPAANIFDRAAPVFTAAYARAGDSTVVAQLTETVQNINVAAPILGGGGDSALNGGDVCYVTTSDEAVSAASFSQGTATITMAAKTGNGNSAALESGDINVANTIGFGDADGDGCSVASIEDAAGNDAAAGRIRPITDTGSAGDFVVGAFGDAGTDEVLVIFNGPVTAAGGGAIGVSALQYVNNKLGGATGIASVAHTAGSNIVRITTTGTLASADMAAGGDQIRVVGGAVQALGDDDNRNAVALVNIDAGQAAQGKYAPVQHNRLAPRITAAFTQDADVDGIVDAILVLFSEQVTNPADGWSLHQISGAGRTTVSIPANPGQLANSAACGGGSLPDVANAVYICVDENPATGSPLGTDAKPVLGYTGTDLADVGGVKLAPVVNFPVADAVRPVVQQYRTLDRDSNGQVDAIEIELSEAVSDNSFRADEWTVIDPVDFNEVGVAYKGTFGNGNDVPFTVTGMDTGATANDRFIRLVLAERGTPDTHMMPGVKFTRKGGLSDPAGTGIATFDTTDITGGGSESALPNILDGARPVLVSAGATVGSPSLIMAFSEGVQSSSGGDLGAGDLIYNNVNQAGASGFDGVPEHNAGESVVTAVLNRDLTSNDFSSDTVTVNAASVYDFAASTAVDFGNGIPVSHGNLVANQLTKPLSGLSNPTIQSAVTLDRNADGTLDGIRVTFDQSMDDGASCNNLDTAEWSVRVNGVPLSKSLDNFIVQTGSGAGCTGTDKNDATIFLLWTPSTNTAKGWHTGALPTISYASDSQGGFIRSASGEPLGPVSNLAATDGAAPVLLTASGSASDKNLVLTFSEGVYGSAAGGKIRFQDLVYIDDNSGGASAFNVIQQHTPGASTATVTLNQDLTASDIANGDAVRPATTIKDVAGLGALPQTSPFVDIQDLTAPRLDKLETLDADADGRLDGIRVVFNEPLTDGTGCNNLDKDDWTVRVGTTDLPVTAVHTKQDGSCAGTGLNDATIFLRFAPSTEVHTGVRPTVAHTPDIDSLRIQDTYGNQLGTIGSTMAADKAAPVLLGPVETRDRDGDGRIDAYAVRISEPIKDSSFKAGDWAVADAADGSKHTGIALLTGSAANDESFAITFVEGAAADTGETPALTYTPKDHLMDVADNKLVVPSSIAEADKAAPTVTGVTSAVDSKTVTVTFSEAVCGTSACTAPASNLATGAFTYTNGNSAGAGGLDAAAHTANGKTVTLTLDVAATSSDRENDLIGPQEGRILDANGNTATFAPVNLRGASADTVAPAQITDLTVTPGTERLIVGWTSPADTDVASLDIRISTAAIDSDAAFLDAFSVTDADAPGDVATIPTPRAGSAQTVTITGLTAGTEYFFAIRSVDGAGNIAPRSASVSGIPEEPDTTNPGTITDLSFLSAGGNSVTFEFSPVGDDGSTGTVTAYEVKVSTSPIETAADFAAAGNATAGFTPTPLLAGGSTAKQSVVVTRIDGNSLAPETMYYVAVRGVDEAQNKGGFDTASGSTTDEDVTAPTGTLTITSSTHPSATGVENDDPTFSWSGLTDAESTITYHYVLDSTPGTTVTAATTGSNAGSTTAATASFSNVGVGTWYFHVAGVSQGGVSATAHYNIVILEPGVEPVDADIISAANDAIQASLKVERVGNDNVLTWDVPTGTDPAPAGVQVWKSESPFRLQTNLNRFTNAFQDGKYTDVGASADAKYVLTVYFADDPVGGKMSRLGDAPGYTDKTDEDLDGLGASPQQTDGGQPTDGGSDGGSSSGGNGNGIWFLFIGGAILLLIVLAVVVVIVLRRGGPE